MINQICIAGIVQGLSEAMAFGKKSKLRYGKSFKSYFKRSCSILANGK